MTDQTIEVTLTPSEIQYVMDLMVGCPLGYSTDCMVKNGINDARLYDQFENCLPNHHSVS